MFRNLKREGMVTHRKDGELVLPGLSGPPGRGADATLKIGATRGGTKEEVLAGTSMLSN